jgi:hypothetical protein
VNAWVFAVALLLVTSSVTTAEQRRDGSYFCNDEIVAGLSYNANLGKWQSTTFKPESKFILRLKFVQSRTEILGGAGGMSFAFDEYVVSITEAGKEFAAPCGRRGEKTANLHDGFLACDAADLHSYRFNFTKNRFLRIYSEGFVTGKDSNDDTPAVAGGTCTKID